MILFANLAHLSRLSLLTGSVSQANIPDHGNSHEDEQSSANCQGNDTAAWLLATLHIVRLGAVLKGGKLEVAQLKLCSLIAYSIEAYLETATLVALRVHFELLTAGDPQVRCLGGKDGITHIVISIDKGDFVQTVTRFTFLPSKGKDQFIIFKNKGKLLSRFIHSFKVC